MARTNNPPASAQDLARAKARALARPQTPQTFKEWLWSRFPPSRYVVQWQTYGVTGLNLAAQLLTFNWPTFPAPFYCFCFNAVSWVTATGALPTFPVRYGVQYTNGNNWTGGNFAGSLIGGAPFAASAFKPYPVEWEFPREIAQNDVLTLTVDNTLGAAQAITTDAILSGYEVRTRTVPLPSRAVDQIR